MQASNFTSNFSKNNNNNKRVVLYEYVDGYAHVFPNALNFILVISQIQIRVLFFCCGCCFYSKLLKV